LLTRVKDVMRKETAVPFVQTGSLLSDALVEMTAKGLGLTAIVNAAHEPIGVFTDGDLRRAFACGIQASTAIVDEVMHKSPLCIAANQLAIEAVDIMEQKKINGLLVTDETGKLVGAFNMHDILIAKVI
jgi:arabinose-5-phosphate isomerase